MVLRDSVVDLIQNLKNISYWETHFFGNERTLLLPTFWKEEEEQGGS